MSVKRYVLPVPSSASMSESLLPPVPAPTSRTLNPPLMRANSETMLTSVELRVLEARLSL